MTDALFWLTLTALLFALLWAPYVLERILRIGLMGAFGYAKDTGTAGFEQPTEQAALWARRAHAAHRNALESFPVFAVLVLIAHVTGTAVAVAAPAALIYFLARILHFVCYVIGIPVLRTLSFFAAFGAILAVALGILGIV